jgi:DNA-directed RNA polymerase specialized sigma24 family protein
MLDLSLRSKDRMEEFVLKYENRLYRTAIAMVGNKADSEELEKDVFIK